MLEKGYAKQIDKNTERSRIWYVPIFGIYNINKPNKVRVVFDCAAKTNGISLNDQLDAGPDLLRPLPGILIRFRQYAVAIKSDISDMFLRVKIIEHDKAIRYLYRGRDRHREPDEFECTCLIFGAASSPTSAIFIKNKNAQRYAKSKPLAVQGIIDDSYMDDLISSQKSDSTAVEFIQGVIKINSEAGFQMHGWASNKSEVINKALNIEDSPKSGQTSLGKTENERVLGMYWDTETDELKFNVKLAKIPIQILRGQRIPTKREVLSVIMSIYDPLGLIAPFTLKSKVLMQANHRSGIHWDDKLREEEYTSWLIWLSETEKIKHCKINRCYTPSGTNEEAQLHVFCDASMIAFAAAAYLRFEKHDGKAHVALVMTKNRTASLKRETIPRLELQAALLGARLANFLKNELRIKITRRVFCSDSSTVIQWIRSEPREHNIFVANRLGEIAELTQSSEWKWVPTADNPADDATRLENDALRLNSRWFNGPSFLSQNEKTWPAESFPEELQKLKHGESINKQSKIAILNPYVDKNQILRASGRVTLLLGDFNNEPIILNGKHSAVKNLITHFHRKYYHSSSNTVINELR
ncbi:uncharacterized protein LOC131668288 [Phymastichus coffea]|uniref:uncharacterized protein LOC131668288 n=1 Tax=Phymastichus coffea TaxID=108790 RepID=UPI00273A8DAA|nr:uncharacterized protein LOC131668288 [Phymastichus coffea]